MPMFTRPNKLVVVVEIERSFQSYVKLVFVLSYSLAITLSVGQAKSKWL